MNWIQRRPFRHQLPYGGGTNMARVTFREHFPVSKRLSDQPIDAIRLQLADYNNHQCPVHHRHEHRDHPYITTFSDQQSSVQRTRSSIHSISTIETDFVHQRVSTIHTFPSSASMIERQEMIDDEPILGPQNQLTHQMNNNHDEINQPINVDVVQEEEPPSPPPSPSEANECRTCLMLIEIVDQQAQQIRQYTEQISQQADLLAKLARRFAGIEEGIDDQKSDDNNTEQQRTNQN